MNAIRELCLDRFSPNIKFDDTHHVVRLTVTLTITIFWSGTESFGRFTYHPGFWFTRSMSVVVQYVVLVSPSQGSWGGKLSALGSTEIRPRATMIPRGIQGPGLYNLQGNYHCQQPGCTSVHRPSMWKRLDLELELEANTLLKVSSETRPHSAPPTSDNGCLASSSKYNSRGSLGSNATGVFPSESSHGRQRRPGSGKAVRPLPPTPSATSPVSATQGTIKTCSRIIRPLPLTPCESPLYTTTTVVTPNAMRQTLSQPPAYAPSGSTRKIEEEPAVSSEPMPPGVRPVFLTISTNMEQPLVSDEVHSPLSPEPPTPRTQRRQRLSKLQRHFGESIPEEVVRCPRGKGIETIGENEMYLKAAVAARKILEMTCGEDQEGGESQSEDEDEEEGGQEEVYWTVFRSKDQPRWVLERGCYRREEPNYDKVIKALRAL